MELVYSIKGIIEPDSPGQGCMDMKNADLNQAVLDFSVLYPDDKLEKKAKAGEAVSLNKTCEFEVDVDAAEHALQAILQKLSQNQVKIAAAYAPYLKRDTKRDDLKDFLIGLTEDCIRLCGKIGCPFIIIRPWTLHVCKEDLWEANLEYYMHFAQIARKNQVTILLENQCRNINGHLVRGVCADGEEMSRWLDSLNDRAGEQMFEACFNAGTANLCGQNMQDFITKVGKRLRAVVIRDCNGHDEASLLPFSDAYRQQAKTDWLGFIRGLREIEFDGQLIMDCSDSCKLFSPILRPALLRLMKKEAEYFQWQAQMEKHLKKYTSLVLFGAGNMCRNYMQCYGEAYPPLFTCDNNKNLWGSEFCGLEVKAPVSLKNIPPECGILICNSYYREIEEQLRDMGIENGIEFFNDEYMPAFPFDRLDRR